VEQQHKLDLGNKILIKCFGSCRLEPLHNNFNLGSLDINKSIMYSWSTKEILMGINYLKNNNSINNYIGPTKYFGFLENQQNILKYEFLKANAFIIEISSNKAFKCKDKRFWRDFETNYNGLQVYEIDREETKKDMIDIINQLYPRPVLFVTHICTFNYGDRFKYKEIIIDVAKEIGANYFDPSEVFMGYNSNTLLLDKDHLTDFAKDILSEEYKKIVNKVFKTS